MAFVSVNHLLPLLLNICFSHVVRGNSVHVSRNSYDSSNQIGHLADQRLNQMFNDIPSVDFNQNNFKSAVISEDSKKVENNSGYNGRMYSLPARISHVATLEKNSGPGRKYDDTQYGSDVARAPDVVGENKQEQTAGTQSRTTSLSNKKAKHRVPRYRFKGLRVLNNMSNSKEKSSVDTNVPPVKHAPSNVNTGLSAFVRDLLFLVSHVVPDSKLSMTDLKVLEDANSDISSRRNSYDDHKGHDDLSVSGNRNDSDCNKSAKRVKRVVPGVKHCQLEQVEIQVEFRENLETEAGSEALVCRGMEQISRCEGACVSSAKPSAFYGIQIECSCCKDTSTMMREITLRSCFLNEQPVDGYFLTRAILEPTSCACQECRR